MNLPKLPYQIQKKTTKMLQLSGLNLTDNYNEGAIEDSLNMTSDRYPVISTKPDREYALIDNCTALTTWGDLVYVQNRNLIYKGQNVGKLSLGEKQFAMLHKYLVVWPDKKLLDTTTMKLIDMAVSVTGDNAVYTSDSITVEWDVDFTKLFYAGDTLNFEGVTGDLNSGDHNILEVYTKKLVFESDTVTAGDEINTITISRKIPDLDFICESGNRLWGCSNTDQTIYCSKLDDPMNFYDYSGTANDAYAVSIASEGDFTACTKLASSVLFWKANKLHKILGSMPEEYQLYSYDTEGVPAGSHKSLTVINDTLYFAGIRGIYTYSGGGGTSYISYALGDRNFTKAVAGNDGDHYYVSAKENDQWSLYVYDLLHGLWMKEDEIEVADFARIGNMLYLLLTDMKVYKESSNTYSEDQKFKLVFKPVFDTYTDSSSRSYTAFNYKRHSKVILRTELGLKARAKVEVKLDDGQWQLTADLEGKKNGITPVVMPLDRNDKFQLRITGTGKFTLHSLERVYALGGDR